MKIGIVGLGRMGRGMVSRLMDGKHKVVAYDMNPGAVEAVAAQGAIAAASLKQLTELLAAPRLIWIMVPAGKPVDDVLFQGLAPYLEPGDIIIDGGNSNYKDSIRRAQNLWEREIYFLDVGTSGGLGGADVGFSLMVGGQKEAFNRARPVLEAVAAPGGFAHLGGSGAGHFVKAVHNGIEYALLQCYGEGFELLKASPFQLDLLSVSRVWNRGGVVRSWLLELVESALEKDPQLSQIGDEVGGGETGMWAVEAALENNVPFTTLGVALSQRFQSRQAESFATKLVAALRREFGGHEVAAPKK